MAKYLEIRNAKQNIVIDDQFKTPTFVRKVVVSGGFAEIGAPIAGAQTLYCWKYRRIISGALDATTFKNEFGIDPQVLRNTNEGDLSMVFSRNSSSSAFYVVFKMYYVESDNAYMQGTKTGDGYYSLTIYTDDANSVVTASIYTNNTRIPSTFGKQAFNAQGELTFDAVRGVISNAGVMSGNIDLNQEIAATYSFPLPIGLDPTKLMISHRSTLPIRTAYKIGSSGVSMSWTKFAPIMYVDVNTNTLTVKLTRQTNLSGSNSASNIGGFYENVIYCTYPDKELPASQR